MASSNSRTFHPFPKLPFELRAEIWQYAVPELPPRIVPLKRLYHSLPPSCPVPSLLYTCHESRIAALTRYSRWRLPRPSSPMPQPGDSVAYIYVSITTDIFVLDYSDLKDWDPAYHGYPDLRLDIKEPRPEGIRPQIRHVLFLGDDWRNRMQGPSGEILSVFTGLETVNVSVQGRVDLESIGRLSLQEYSGSDERDVLDFVEVDYETGVETWRLSAEEALEVVKNSVLDWRMPIVRAVLMVA